MSYKNIKLDRSRIVSSIYDFCINKSVGNYKIGALTSSDGIRYRINVDMDDKEFFIDFHFVMSKGNEYKTTIQTGQGNYLELQEEIATFITENAGNISEDYIKLNKEFEKTLSECKKSNDPLVYKKIDKTIFNKLIDMIKNDNFFSSLDIIKDEETVKIFKIYSTDGNEVTVTHFINNASSTLMIQGKPFLLFSACSAYMAELIDNKTNIDALNSYYGTSFTKEEIEAEYNSIFPNAKNHLNTKIKRTLCQALQNRRDMASMFDCTHLVFSALRGLEGHLRYLLDSKGFMNVDTFNMFDPVKNSLGEKIGGTLQCIHYPKFGNDMNKIACVNETYNMIFILRNSLFHWNKPNILGDTTKLLERSEVEPILVQTFEIIEKYFA